MAYIIPWMPIYPDKFKNMTIEILHEKYYEKLKYKYLSSFYPKYMPLSEEIYNYINNGTFPLSIKIKYLLKTVFNNCVIVNVDYQTYFQLKYNNIIFTFYIYNMLHDNILIIMTYNSHKIEHCVNSINEFHTHFIKPYFHENIVFTDDIIEKSNKYSIEAILRMAIFVIWISEDNNIIYLKEYENFNKPIKYSEFELLDNLDNEFDELLNILQDKCSIKSNIDDQLTNIFQNKSLKNELDFLNKQIDSELFIKNEIELFNKEIDNECVLCMDSSDNDTNKLITLSCCNTKCHLFCIKEWITINPSCCTCNQKQYGDKNIIEYINQIKKEIDFLNNKNDLNCAICNNIEAPSDEKTTEQITLPCCNMKCHLFCIKQWITKNPSCYMCNQAQHDDINITEYINQILKIKRKQNKKK